MAAEDPLLVMLGLAFLPALFYLGGLSLRHPGRSAGPALTGFFYGATLSLAVLAVLYVALAAFLGNPVQAFQSFFADRSLSAAQDKDFVVIVVLAPLLEEAAKGFGVFLLGWRLASARDGAFLGAAVGLGFAGMETFTYLLAAFAAEGSTLGSATLVNLAVLAGARSVSAALLHPAATGITGYGIARARLRGVPSILGAAPFYAVAVGLHAAYNYLAAFLPPQQVGGLSLEVNFLAAVVFASIAWGFIKRGVAARS